MSAQVVAAQQAVVKVQPIARGAGVEISLLFLLG